MVEGSGIEDHMRVDVRLVHMGAADKSVTALGQLHGKLVADPVCRGRVNFPRFEALPKMVGDHIVFAIVPVCYGGIVTFGKQKLLINADRITFISGNPLTVISLFRIFHIVRTSSQRGGNAFPRADGKQCCGCQQ